MNNSTQTIVTVVIALVLGAAGFSTLNNLNNVNQLQQKLDELTASVQSQPELVPSIDEVAETQSNVQQSAIQQAAACITTESEQHTVEPKVSNDVLTIESGQTLLLTKDMPNLQVNLVYSLTQPTTIHLQALVAQDSQGEAIDLGYHSDEIQTALTETIASKVVQLPFQPPLPPTGRYLAQIVARSPRVLVSQPVTLAVANEPAMTLQYRLTGTGDDKRIIIAGGRGCPPMLNWLDLIIPNCSKVTWNTSELLLWEKYLRPSSYHILTSELADSVNGRFGHLGISINKERAEIGPSTSSNVLSVTVGAEPLSVTLMPSEDIIYSGAYTGTLTIVDVDNHWSESIPILVRARDHSAIPFFLMLFFYLGIALIINRDSTAATRKYNWNRVAISFIWALLVAVAGMVYIENRLPTFGSASDYFAALGWMLGVTVIAATGAVVINRIMDGWLKDTSPVPPVPPVPGTRPEL